MRRPESIRGYRWRIASPIPFETSLTNQGPYHPVLRRVLHNRGLHDEVHIQAFLEGRYLESTDPFQLAGVEKAVARIHSALANQERVAVYGDFDADGVTSTVLLTQGLRNAGFDHRQIRPYIPDRVDEGYGLNKTALSQLREEGVTLVISVDCGIRAVHEADHAHEIGLDLIVTDHHTIGDHLPQAVAVINPKRQDSAYPEKNLAGVGIAFKLVQALHEAFSPSGAPGLDSYLDLVALGTVADLAPLIGENRRLVMDGLQVINSFQRPGLAALAQTSGLKRGAITAESIGFGLGPRINAAGRLAHAYTAAKLLAANNDLQARQLASELNELNRRRRKLTEDLGQQAEEMVDGSNYILIAASETFESGIVGLVASRLMDKYYRPAIIMERGADESRASCRSIPEFHITDALDSVADLLVRHGGHQRAAGFTICNENIAEFAKQMSTLAEDALSDLDLKPTLDVDAEIMLNDADWALQGSLARLEPTGQENQPPLFASRNVEVVSHRAVGNNGAHLQLRLATENGTSAPRILPAIAFRQGDWAAMMPQRIDLVYSLGVNEWNGKRDLQLMVRDIQPAEA